MDVESIFAAAVKIHSETQRQAFLDDACGENAQLRAEVESLLNAHAAAGSFLNHPPAGLGPAMEADARAEQTVETGADRVSLPFLGPCNKPDRIGKLGVYEIIEVVGRGGMGIVLRACDTKLNRTVAVKVLAPELAANPMAVKRFLSEAQKAAAVVHEHVVTIHAVDDAHCPPFLVMEFIAGQTLQQKIDREGALPLTPILRIATQIAEGLAAAHRCGLIHRDVKPANVLLENGVERVKIADFGLARAADDVKATQSGSVTGTPQYMSPEQARGEPVDHRSDLFSFGSVLYAMCTGRPAFRADNPLAAMRRICEDHPRPIREVNPEIPDWLVAIIDRLLEKDPEHRFQRAEEVATLLGRHLAYVQTPSQAPPPGNLSAPAAGERGSLPALSSQKHVRRLVAGAAITAVLVGVIVWQLLPRPPHPDAVRWSERDGGNGHWYVAIIDSHGISWAEADQRARAMNGHLVTITSPEEDDFVVRLLNDARYWYAAPDTGFMRGPWTGAVQLEGAREPDGGWRWVTGEPFLYSNWRDEEPNDGRSPYGPQQRIFYHTESTEWLKAYWADAGDATSLERGLRSFVVEFDGLPLANEHPKDDPYASLVLQPSPANHISLVARGQKLELLLRRRFADKPRTAFVIPGVYSWEILDGSKDNQRIGRGSIELRGGERVEFTSDGRVLQSGMPGTEVTK